MKQKVFMSWKWVDDQIDELAKRLKSRELRYISGIPRGGLIPAIMLSHKLNVTYIPFDEAKKFGRHDLRFKNEDILLVDDICDSGVTMKDYAPRFITATLCMRYVSETIPEYYGEKIEDDRWLVFPWERNDSNTKQDYLDN
jgi:hypoxanthine phosphoribosyltransferase|tara:strand:+ start:8643 stop:9065 length:423 start_codon:yes stop_codon:yes gene_type:complete